MPSTPTHRLSPPAHAIPVCLQAFEAPATSSSGPDEESLESSLPATPSSEGDYYYSFSFSYDFEAGETSYSYDYEFPPFY